MKNNLSFMLVFLTLCVAGLVLGNLFVKLLVITLIGVLCHYFNGINKLTIDCDLVAYFTGAFKNTLASLGGCIIAVFAITQSGHPDTLDYMVSGTAFAAGYLSDSALNKPPNTGG